MGGVQLYFQHSLAVKGAPQHAGYASDTNRYVIIRIVELLNTSVDTGL